MKLRSGNTAMLIWILALVSCKDKFSKIDSLIFYSESEAQLLKAGFEKKMPDSENLSDCFQKFQNDTLITIFASQHTQKVSKIVRFSAKAQQIHDILNLIERRADVVFFRDENAALIKEDEHFFLVQVLRTPYGSDVQVSYFGVKNSDERSIVKEYLYYSLKKSDSVNYKIRYEELLFSANIK